MGAQKPQAQACTAKHYQVSTKDLPLSCPMPNSALWNAHPKVFLPIEKTGSARCPYCSAEYKLVDFQPDGDQ